jgi:hypothetical protein
MFITRYLSGERAMSWRPDTMEPEPTVRVMLPGAGQSVQARARSAEFVPSIQATGGRARGAGSRPPGQARNGGQSRLGAAGAGSGSSRRPATRRVILSGDLTPHQVAWQKFSGNPSAIPMDCERMQSLGLSTGLTPVFVAAMDLSQWRHRGGALPPGPELVSLLADRPDTLAPAPVAAPERAAQVASDARRAGVTDQVLTGYANAVLDSITARAKVIAWLQAEQYTDLALLSRNYPGLAEMLPTEVGFALRTSDAGAGNAISTARTMTMRLPDTLEALRAGLIDAGHAMALASATASTTAEVTAAVEADLLPLVTAAGSTITAEQLRRRAVRRVIRRDPDGAADRHKAARQDRCLTRWVEDDGMAGLKVLAPVEQIAAMWEAATALADAAKGSGDTRSLGNRRVDALADLCSAVLDGQALFTPPASPAAGAAPAPRPAPGPAPRPAPAARSESTPPENSAGEEPSAAAGRVDPNTTEFPATEPSTISQRESAEHTAVPPRAPVSGCSGGSPFGPATPPAAVRATLTTRHGQRPHIQVLVPYTVLLGGNDPCELAGSGAISADQARLIIADGVLQRILYDPASGTVLDYGRTRYEPPESLKQFVIARDGTCRAPGCNQPALRCQIDHVERFRPGRPTGGCTDHVNLHALCAHHHRAKDGGGFTVIRAPDGATHWTTPLGREYREPPNQVPEVDDPPPF